MNGKTGKRKWHGIIGVAALLIGATAYLYNARLIGLVWSSVDTDPFQLGEFAMPPPVEVANQPAHAA